MKPNKSMILHKIRKLIPKMECIEGCHECCGPVVFTKTEWDKVRIKRQAVSIHCPYITDNSCEIYDNRAILCRLFGVVERMPCPYGMRPEQILTKDEEARILRLWGKLK